MFVYTLKLDIDLIHHKQLEKRFRMASDIYQETLREILKRVRKQKKTRYISELIVYQKGLNEMKF